MLAIDYRPKTFSEVVGQELPKEVLKQVALADGIKVRAILLHGAYGSGKSSLARIFGKAMNCPEFQKTGEVCNQCEHCRSVNEGTSQAYLEYDSTRVGNVDDIKSLIDRLQIKNFQGRRVVCIDEVHAVSRQAQTALLKVLEEGVTDTVFVFATTDNVIKTIESRSVKLDFQLIAVHELKRRVLQVAEAEGIQITEEQAEAVAVKAQGHARNAMQILEQFAIAGDESLRTSYKDLRKYIVSCLQKKPSQESLLNLLQYPLVDIRQSVYQFLNSCFTSQEKLFETIRQKGLANKLFKFFYAPEAVQALKDEFGTEILLRSLAESL